MIVFVTEDRETILDISSKKTNWHRFPSHLYVNIPNAVRHERKGNSFQKMNRNNCTRTEMYRSVLQQQGEIGDENPQRFPGSSVGEIGPLTQLRSPNRAETDRQVLLRRRSSAPCRIFIRLSRSSLLNLELSTRIS